jgi:hypothetical protein
MDEDERANHQFDEQRDQEEELRREINHDHLQEALRE